MSDFLILLLGSGKWETVSTKGKSGESLHKVRKLEIYN